MSMTVHNCNRMLNIPPDGSFTALQRQAELEAQVALLTQKLAEAQSELVDSNSRSEHEKAELRAQLFEAQRDKPAPHADSTVIDADASSHSTIARLEASVKRLKAAAETAVGFSLIMQCGSPNYSCRKQTRTRLSGNRVSCSVKCAP